MTFWIPQYLTNGKVEATDSQTLIVDLPKNEQIGHLMAELRVTNSATVYNNHSILDEIDKIEVVADGSKVLFSATPEVASYLAFVAQNGVLPDHRFFDGASAVSRLHLPIFFGRFPWDEGYVLDTGQYNSVQLWITYSLDTTYSTTGTFTHTLSYWRPLEKLSPTGMVRSREIKVETSGASAQTIRHNLSIGWPWHLLGARIFDYDQDINTTQTDIELNVDSGRLMLMDVNIDELYFEMFRKYANANAYVNQPVVTGSDTAVHLFGEWGFPRGAVALAAAARIPTIVNVAGEQCDIYVYTDAGLAATDAIPVALDVRSAIPHQCVTLLDGRQQPFPIGNYKESWVEYTQGAYAVEYTTFVQEIAPLKI